MTRRGCKIEELENKASEPDFWNDAERSQIVLKELKVLKDKLGKFDSLQALYEEIELMDLPKYKAHSYLLMRSQDKQHWLINNDPKMYIPRQYVRQLIAEEYAIPGDAWNWRTHPFEDKMHETIRDITSTLLKYEDQLPERIRINTRFLLDAN